MCLATEVFPFHIKNHMAWYLLITNRSVLFIQKDLKGNTYLFHLLGNGIGPDGIAVLTVKLTASLTVRGTSMPNLWVRLR